MKHAVLSATGDNEPAAKRRKIQRQQSVRSYRSTDSGYNSDNVSDIEASTNTTTDMTSKHTNPPVAPEMSSFSFSSSNRKSSVTMPASPSTHSEEDYTDVIARARARLYSNASLSIPSPPVSTSQDSPGFNTNADYSLPSPSSTSHDEFQYPSPVSVEPSIASSDTTSGCNLGTFISLGLAVTSHERNLLTTLVPEPKALPSWQMEAWAAKRMSMLEAQRRLREQERRRREGLLRRRPSADEAADQQEQARRSSYAGFAIGCHDGEDEEEFEGGEVEGEGKGLKGGAGEASDAPLKSVEAFDDFFDVDAACEQEGEHHRASVEICET